MERVRTRDKGLSDDDESLTANDKETRSCNRNSDDSIMMDANLFEEQFLRCEICQECFHETERSPKILPCNHTFCVICLTSIFKHAQLESGQHSSWDETIDFLNGPLKCPTCRVEIFVGEDEISSLPTDHKVIQMIDFMSHATLSSKSICRKHSRQPLSFFCRKCRRPICRDCTVLDHKEQQGHDIVDVEEALIDMSVEFDQIEKLCRLRLKNIKTRKDALIHATRRLDMQELKLAKEVEDSFTEYILLLEKRKEALIENFEQRLHDQKALINERFEYVYMVGSRLQKLSDSFRQAKTSNDVENMFSLHKDIKVNESEFNSVATSDDNDLFKTCIFEATTEGEFLSSISSLGHVASKADITLKEPLLLHQLLCLETDTAVGGNDTPYVPMGLNSDDSDLCVDECDTDIVCDTRESNDDEIQYCGDIQERSRYENFEIRQLLSLHRLHGMTETVGRGLSNEDVEHNNPIQIMFRKQRRRPHTSGCRSLENVTAQFRMLTNRQLYNSTEDKHSTIQEPPRAEQRSRSSRFNGGIESVEYTVERHSQHSSNCDEN